MTDPEIPLEASLNLETARIRWRELERFFAAGRAIAVAPELDLVAVGAEMARDNAQRLQQWMEEGRVEAVSDDQAQTWHERDTDVWALVIRPYVLVQGPAQN